MIAGDGGPSESVIEAARGADVLVHEATFCEDERERARETQHSTAHEAAGVARAAEVGLLALTHLSNRYFGGEVAREARTIFPNTVVPRDFDTIDVRFQERGGPELVKGGAAQKRGRARGRAVGRGGSPGMTRMVQVAMAGDVTEAEEIQTILRSAGIDAELEAAVEHHPSETEDAPQKVLVPEELARGALSTRSRRSPSPRSSSTNSLISARVAGRYDELRPADENWWELFELLVREGDLVGRRVLDIGCGTGRAAAALVERGSRVWGVEPEPEMAARARERLSTVKVAPAERFRSRTGGSSAR